MPYQYLSDIATADAALKAWGEMLEGLSTAAAEATMSVMGADLATIAPEQQRRFSLEAGAMDMVLFELLQEIVFDNDAEQLLLRVADARISGGDDHWSLTATAVGEPLNMEKHELAVNVKAVPLHRFHVERTGLGWAALVFLDI